MNRTAIAHYAIYHRTERDIENDYTGTQDDNFIIYEGDDEAAIVDKILKSLAKTNKAIAPERDQLAEIDPFEGTFLNWVR